MCLVPRKFSLSLLQFAKKAEEASINLLFSTLFHQHIFLLKNSLFPFSQLKGCFSFKFPSKTYNTFTFRGFLFYSIFFIKKKQDLKKSISIRTLLVMKIHKNYPTSFISRFLFLKLKKFDYFVL